MEVRDRVAVVTGAAIGIGRAIALTLAEAGARVVVADIDTSGGEETVRRSQGRARFRAADMTRQDDIVELVRSEEPAILVNNAGGGGQIPPHFPEAAPAQWEAATERLTPSELASEPPPIPLDVVAGAALSLIQDDTLAGRVMVLERGVPPRLLSAELPD
jgi:NAD(P)-dependent dehydrogenase (short-subunit alcohol dehydrogenase family)